MTNITIQVIDRIDGIDPAAWNALLPDSNPFLRHEFLAGLENHGCISEHTGWSPQHFVAKNEQNELTGAMPAYLKYNSFGEFVFDWSWASAYENAGLAYYPKLVSAVPYTPVTGPRLLVHPQADRAAVSEALINAAKKHVRDNRLSGFHCLFPDDADSGVLNGQQLLQRTAWQYHWHNRGYRDFEHYLSFFRSRKRKNVRHERRHVLDTGIQLRVLHGDELDEDQWRTVYRYYCSTFQKKGNYPALTAAFFQHLATVMPRNLVIVVAEYQSQIIAAAINLCSKERLYGRYWGSELDVQHLHFEVCFYQGIEYCIRNGLQAFEPGAQGEHKITRGFLPVKTYSMHWIEDIRFRTAIADFLQREEQALAQHGVQLDKLSPFHGKDSA
jgi:hypothetical protein